MWIQGKRRPASTQPTPADAPETGRVHVAPGTQEDTGLVGAYSQVFLRGVLRGGGAWCREARIVVALAAQEGIALDEEMLILSDVRDLQALSARYTSTQVRCYNGQVWRGARRLAW